MGSERTADAEIGPLRACLSRHKWPALRLMPRQAWERQRWEQDGEIDWIAVQVQWFRGGLVWKAHIVMYHSTRDFRVVKKRKRRRRIGEGRTFPEQGHGGGEGTERESSLLTTYWSEST